MSSFLYNYNFYLTRNNTEFYLGPLSLLGDIVGLPILLVADIVDQSYHHILVPIGNFIGRVLNLVPKEVIEFLLKSTVFIVPATVLALGAYGACVMIGFRSLTTDIKGIAECTAEFLSSIISPTVVAGLAAGIFIGSQFAGGSER